MKIVASIEARMTSTRLPGKVLLPIMGKSMLEYLIERVRESKKIDQIVVATTNNDDDDPIVDLCNRVGIASYRGSENDVLDRVLNAVKSVNGDIIVELTGDCPLLDPIIIDETIDFYLKNNFDYVSNCLSRTFPIGYDTQVFSFKVLERVHSITQDPADREHVSLFIYEHPEIFSLWNIRSNLSQKWWSARLTVDTKEDFLVISSIFEALYPKFRIFGLDHVITYLDNNPAIMNINSHIIQKKTRP